jgi:hypothetical protein
MRRILALLRVALVKAAMMVAMALPAFAEPPFETPAFCSFEPDNLRPLPQVTGLSPQFICVPPGPIPEFTPPF